MAKKATACGNSGRNTMRVSTPSAHRLHPRFIDSSLIARPDSRGCCTFRRKARMRQDGLHPNDRGSRDAA